jgi:rabankyrin-5
LALLREEYVKLQNKHTELERRYNLLNSIHGAENLDKNNDSFIARLLRTISELFNKELYSDLTIKLNGCELKAHKFVLDARSKRWANQSLSQINELDLTGNIFNDCY